MSENLRTTLARMPKVELHRHLEGSIRPSTLAEVCREHGVPLPTYDADVLTDLLRVRKPAENLAEFLKPFGLIKYAFVDTEAISRITFEAVEDAALDNVRYMELRFSPEYMGFYHKLRITDVLDAVVKGVELATRKLKVDVKLIVSICRDRVPDEMGPFWPSSIEVARTAVDYADRGVVGLDLSGIEPGFPPEMFQEPFRIARQAGLGITVHAGEAAGPENVRSAIEQLGATRVGHGVRVIQDEQILQLVKKRGITLELCPTSNVLTRAISSLQEHPIRKFYKEGIPVTVNTDDPTLCGVSLTEEYIELVDNFGFAVEDIGRLIDNARRAAFAKSEG